MNRAVLQAKENKGEFGQAMIFFAIMASALMMMTGLAVEGGRLLVEYRHMQAAVDMAALVGAQDLPCPGTLSCSDDYNEAYWCAFVNYYGSGQVPGDPSATCNSSGTAQSAVSGPITVSASAPTSCSPYDSLDYGNDGTNANCNQTTPRGPGTGYIEVQMWQSIQVPIFNTAFTMYTHAVARHGEPSPKDFAMTILNPTISDALKLAGTRGNGLIVVGSAMSDSTATSGGGSIDTGGSAGQVTCDGGWYTAAAESIPSNLFSATGGTSVYAPSSCIAASGQTCDSPTASPAQPPCDNPTIWRPDWPYVADPYCASINPPIGALAPTPTNCRGTAPTSAPTMTNCTPCMSDGQVYIWTQGSPRNTGSWTDAASLGTLSGGQNVEFFPGIYPGGIHMSVAAGKSAYAYFNPGVYTLEGDLQITGQTVICTYGAPVCDSVSGNPNSIGSDSTAKPGTTCQDADFTPTSSPYYISSSTWYYYCSPWGQWDTSDLPGRTVTKTPPTFTDGTTPLNGVTFYLVNHANFDMEGSGFAALAFPNPCPGTGTPGTDSVPFFDPAHPGQPSGVDWASSSFGYTYPAGSLAAGDGVTTSSKYVYPSPDVTIAGENNCLNPNTPDPGSTPLNAGNEWTQEFGTAGGHDVTQHLHFLVYARDGQSTIKLAGSGGQNWYGIIYNPGDPTAYGVSGCATPTKCTTSITGSAGATPGHGPAMMIGQVVADNFSYSGDAVTQLFYRPCNPTSQVCNSGPGSGLVQ